MKGNKIIRTICIIIIVGDALWYFYPDIKDMLMSKKRSRSHWNFGKPGEIDFVVINQMPVTIDHISISSEAITDAVMEDSITSGDTARMHLTIADTSDGTYLIKIFTSLKNKNHELGYYTKAAAIKDVIVIIKDSADAELIYPDN